MKRILLVGNPNVGKSVVFSRLTGVRTIASNYPGTTVEFTRGFMRLGEEQAEVVDVPGCYSLDPSSRAEEVAVRMLEEGADVVVAVLDATHLERSLYLTLQLLERKLPVVVALNIWDETKHKGIEIDVGRLEEFLRVPVVPTVAITGAGIRDLVAAFSRTASPEVRPHTPAERWEDIGKIIAEVQWLHHRHHTLLERLQDASVRPLTGLPIAALVAVAVFAAVRYSGEGLINYVFNPLFEHAWRPLLERLSAWLGGAGFFHQLLIGKLFAGEIDFAQSFGLFSTGLYIPVAAVLPYILVFYLCLSLLEDSGYLPRLAVLLDVVFHRLGLHGFAVIPMILGLGCNVPGLMATRVLESRRERLIACTVLSLGVPCVALQAMIFGLLGPYGLRYVLAVYGTLAVVWLLSGLVLNRVLKGFAPELFLEIPPYRVPSARVLPGKLWLRMKGFLREAVPLVLAMVLVVNLLYAAGLFKALAELTAPVVSGLWGLPEEAVAPLILGFLRKDVAAGMLAPLKLSAEQRVIACTLLAVTFPCIAAFVVMLRELGWRDLLKAVGIMLTAAVLVGGAQNLVFILIAS